MSLTVPMADQFEPALVLYCHTPCVLALAVLPTTVTPPSVAPLSTSIKLRPVSALIAAPAGLAVSSLTAARLRFPKPVGASLTALTVTLRLWLSTLTLGDVPDPLSVTVQVMLPVPFASATVLNLRP